MNATDLAPFFAGLRHHGEQPAILAHHVEETDAWTRERLADTIARLGGGLEAHDDFGRGSRAVLFGPASAEWVACALALLRAGRVPVPVDVQIGDDNLEHVLADSAARWVFTTERQAERFAAWRDGQGRRLWLFDGDADDPAHWQALSGHAAEPPGDARPDDEAVVFYTSGTTGRPKGVPLSQRNLAFQLATIRALGMLRADDRVLLPLPLHHVYPFVVGVLGPLAVGAAIVFPRSLTGPQVSRALKQSEATVVVGIPRLYQALVEAVERQVRGGGRLAGWWLDGSLRLGAWMSRHGAPTAGKRLLAPVHRRLGPSLRLLATGGAAMKAALQQRLEAYGWAVIGGYGLTETSPLITVSLPGKGPPGCAGRPVDGLEVRIDLHAGNEGEQEKRHPPGYGEVVVRGPGVFAGYLNLPDATAEVLDEEGWFRTGDLGRFDAQGHLHLAGRSSTMIVTTGGENVQPEDVETAYESQPLIREVGVLERDGKLVGIVVPEPDKAGDAADDTLEQRVRAALDEAGRELASYQRLDDFVLTRRQLERTRLGKLRRHLLAERYDEARESGGAEAPPAPEETLSNEDRNLLEDPVAAGAWKVLRERFAERGPNPNSSLRYDLGVDSLDWLDLTLEIQEATGVTLDDEVVARIETVRDLLEETVRAERTGDAIDSVFDRPESVLGEDDLVRLRPPGRAGTALAALLYGFNRWLMRGAFRLRVEGEGRLPGPGRPFILAPNHVSNLDPLAVAAALPRERLRETFWAGWTGAVFDTRLKRALARPARVLPIDPAGGARHNLAFAAAALGRKHNLVWFPEGSRSSDGKFQPLRKGIGVLLEHLDVTVVPVAIHGTYAALPVGRRWPRRHPVTVRFGEPVQSSALASRGEGEDDAGRITDGLHTVMTELLKVS